jgi:hypothetical protein
MPATEMRPPTLREAYRVWARGFIADALRRNDVNVSATAEEIGMERSALHRKLADLDIRIVKPHLPIAQEVIVLERPRQSRPATLGHGSAPCGAVSSGAQVRRRGPGSTGGSGKNRYS